MMGDWLLLVVPLVILNALVVRMLLYIRKTRPAVFVQAFLGAIALKMVLSLGLLVVVLLRRPEKAVMLAVSFLITYGVATFIEVVVLLRKSN